MPLWFKQEDKWRTYPFAKRLEGKDVYLCCGGPSLKEVDVAKLRVPNAVIVAMNNAYPYVFPDIWIGMDHPHCYPRQLFWEPFMKIMRGGYQVKKCEGIDINSNYNLFFADCAKFEDPYEEIFKEPKDSSVFIWKKNVMTITIHILIWMAARRINIIGCDLSNKQADYHDEKVVLNASNKNWNKRTYNEINNFLKKIVAKANEKGIEINSCTPNSRINEYMNYVDLDEALKKTQKNIPFDGKLYHSSYVED